MSMYKVHLPNAFPYVLELPPEDIRKIVDMLMSSDRTDVPQGSSFAVTVDAHNGNWRLWVSNASYQFITTEYFNLKMRH